MDKCREEFEKIEWVKERSRHVWWSQNNEYCDTGKHPRANASFLNGALHLFREQQAKVEGLQKRVAALEKAEFVLARIRSIASKRLLESILIKEVRQALKGEGTPNLNIDEKGECRHFSTTMFHEGKAECFHCDAVVNEDREIIGKQSKGFSWPAKEGDQ